METNSNMFEIFLVFIVDAFSIYKQKELTTKVTKTSKEAIFLYNPLL